MSFVEFDLVPYREEDGALTAALEADPGVMGNLGGTVDATEAARIHRKRMDGIARGEWYFTIHVQGAARPAGIVGIFKTPWQGGLVDEIGVLLFPEFQAAGIGPEAFRRVAQRGLAEGRFTEIHGFAGVHNEVVHRALRRLGFGEYGDVDLEYEGRSLRCRHFKIDLLGSAPTDARPTDARPADVPPAPAEFTRPA